MKKVENGIYGIGSNPGGGGGVTFTAETRAEFDLLGHKNQKTLYYRETCNRYRIPQDGGPNRAAAEEIQAIDAWCEQNPPREAEIKKFKNESRAQLRDYYRNSPGNKLSEKELLELYPIV